MLFETIDRDELAGACGGCGVRMKLTQYGYPNDPYSDSYTRAGKGAYRNLDSNKSMAITDSGLAALGLNRRMVTKQERWVELRLQGGGVMKRRIDDRAPQREMRADLYMPRGYNARLGDRVNVRLLP
jgi:hypothetical protein